MRLHCLFAAAAIVMTSSVAQAQPQPFIGEVMIFGGNFCPKGWATMEGQLLPISQYVALFSVLGTMYGGNGRTNFALPKANPFTTYGGAQTLTQCIAIEGVFPSRS